MITRRVAVGDEVLVSLRRSEHCGTLKRINEKSIIVEPSLGADRVIRIVDISSIKIAVPKSGSGPHYCTALCDCEDEWVEASLE